MRDTKTRPDGCFAQVAGGGGEVEAQEEGGSGNEDRADEPDWTTCGWPVKEEARVLGVWWDATLEFKGHLRRLEGAIKGRSWIIRRLMKQGLRPSTGTMLLSALVSAKVAFGVTVWGTAARAKDLEHLDVLVHKVQRAVLGVERTCRNETLYGLCGGDSVWNCLLKRAAALVDWAMRNKGTELHELVTGEIQRRGWSVSDGLPSPVVVDRFMMEVKPGKDGRTRTVQEVEVEVVNSRVGSASGGSIEFERSIRPGAFSYLCKRRCNL